MRVGSEIVHLSAQIAQCEAQIDKTVAELFDLTDREIELCNWESQSSNRFLFVGLYVGHLENQNKKVLILYELMWKITCLSWHQTNVSDHPVRSETHRKSSGFRGFFRFQRPVFALLVQVSGTMFAWLPPAP